MYFDQGVGQGVAGMRDDRARDGSGPVAPVRAPPWPVVSAAVCAGVATVLAVGFATVLEPSIPALATGYVLGAMATIALAATYRALRNARRRHPRFRVQRGLDRVATASMGVGFLAGIASAVLLATELAK